MADTYEQNLGQKSSLTVNDYIRVVGSDNASYKQLVSDVAKKIIENYTGSSLAGSSQSVKSALDALNSKNKVKTVTATTTATGAFNLNFQNVDAHMVLGMRVTNTIAYAIHRGDGWGTAFSVQNGVFAPLANTSITVAIYYI